MAERWSTEQARKWAEQRPWLVGCNYTPRTAVNQLEMWQPATFDPRTIDQELGWAAELGLNMVRVFLHDLLWERDAAGFLNRLDQFLDVAQRHGINAMLVFFDSVWHPFPQWGPQREPEPGVHNSGWLQSPGVAMLRDPSCFDRLEDYVRGVAGHFRDDPRVQVWDIWNEPCNANTSSYGPRDLGSAKADLVAPLMAKAFEWVREAAVMQPLTSGVWAGDWSRDETLRQIERLQLQLSDVTSFHCYDGPEALETRIVQLQRLSRPLLCTEYMARGNGSTFEDCLPVFKRHHVACFHWGLVAGRTQTHLPWDSWSNPYPPQGPSLWHHEVFHPDGRPYRESEVACIRELTR